jgi:hypothetical protein
MLKESLLRDSVIQHAVLQAERLVAFLNRDTNLSEGRTRAVEILKFCRQLDEMPTAARSPADARVGHLLRAVNAHLETFRFAPVLSGQNPYFVFWRPIADLSAPDKQIEPLTAKELSSMPPPSFDIEIIRLSLEMTESGTVGRIRQCICGRWFFAQSGKKQVCSDACRIEKFRHPRDPKHATYMRDYRNNPRVKARRRKEKRSGKTE